ncbi:hypothetical protein LMG28688_07135 [Paraburkholderia caffeinitolerans]|uniref:Uncharacterized protein n=1 Tax=Paraburkholderia caffeinitolerans TaxID=1723730 RepID=A0A6J5H3B8_9BURK|nr:hypothetical protein LMG28688_07135 [Paraburkholderia caffeinitolerans]
MQIPHEVERVARQRADHLEALIDEAGAESFPASDPLAVHPEPRPITTRTATGIEPAGTRS